MLPAYIPFHMNPDAVAAHLDFLAKVGVSKDDICCVRTMIEGCMTTDHVAIFDRLLALLPVDLVGRLVNSERNMMQVRPYLWTEDQRAYLSQRALSFEIGSLVMDMRSATGDPEASEGARTMREHASFLSGFLGQPSNGL
jgi:hypothetical protein